MESVVTVFVFFTDSMRTCFWACALAFFLASFVFAQDLAQLQKNITDNLPASLPEDLGSKPPPQELVGSCKKVIEAVNQIYALPDLSIPDKVWALRRETIALIILAYAETPAYYPRLALVSDELERMGDRKLAQVAEKHVLTIGMELAIRTNANFNTQALAERMVMYAEQNPGEESFRLLDSFLQKIRRMAVRPRDRRLAAAAPIFQEYYRRINHTARAIALEPDIQRSTLVGKEMMLMGVDINGKDLDWLALDGKVVLIQFWGTWCVNCKAEFSHLISLYEKYHDRGLEIIAINTGVDGDDERKVKQFIETEYFGGKKIPKDWIMLHEGAGERKFKTTLTKFYGITELPVLILIGQNGKVLDLHPLPSTLENRIEEALSPFATIMDELTDEESQQYEEMKRKRQEEEDQKIQRELEKL